MKLYTQQSPTPENTDILATIREIYMRAYQAQCVWYTQAEHLQTLQECLTPFVNEIIALSHSSTTFPIHFGQAHQLDLEFFGTRGIYWRTAYDNVVTGDCLSIHDTDRVVSGHGLLTFQTDNFSSIDDENESVNESNDESDENESVNESNDESDDNESVGESNDESDDNESVSESNDESDELNDLHVDDNENYDCYNYQSDDDYE